LHIDDVRPDYDCEKRRPDARLDRADASSSRSAMRRNISTKLPKADHDAEEWQVAMQALLLVAEHDGPTMPARIGMLLRVTMGSVDSALWSFTWRGRSPYPSELMLIRSD
jgi:hypothetical protein